MPDRNGRAGRDVGHVHTVSRDAERRLVVELARQTIVENLNLSVVPGDNLFVVPSDLNANVGSGGNGPVADHRRAGLWLMHVHDLCKAVVVGLGQTERAVVNPDRIDREEDCREDLPSRLGQDWQPCGIQANLIRGGGLNPGVRRGEFKKYPSTLAERRWIGQTDVHLIPQPQGRGEHLLPQRVDEIIGPQPIVRDLAPGLNGFWPRIAHPKSSFVVVVSPSGRAPVASRYDCGSAFRIFDRGPAVRAPEPEIVTFLACACARSFS